MKKNLLALALLCSTGVSQAEDVKLQFYLDVEQRMSTVDDNSLLGIPLKNMSVYIVYDSSYKEELDPENEYTSSCYKTWQSAIKSLIFSMDGEEIEIDLSSATVNSLTLINSWNTHQLSGRISFNTVDGGIPFFDDYNLGLLEITVNDRSHHGYPLHSCYPPVTQTDAKLINRAVDKDINMVVFNTEIRVNKTLKAPIYSINLAQ